MTKNGYKVLRLGIISQSYLVMAAQIILEKKAILGNLAVVPEGPIFKNLEDLNESLPFSKFFCRIWPKLTKSGL